MNIFFIEYNLCNSDDDDDDDDDDCEEPEFQRRWKTYVFTSDGRGQGTFSLEDRKFIASQFHDYVKNDAVPTPRTIKDIVASNKRLQRYNEIPKFETRIKGCLVNIRNKRAKLREHLKKRSLV